METNTETNIETHKPEDLRELLSTGYLPSEPYLYHVCDNEYIEIVQILCEYRVFYRVLGQDADLSLYAAKPSVGLVLFENGCISQYEYNLYAQVWKDLDMFHSLEKDIDQKLI